ncbi:MAG: hypothetical protein ACRC68_04000 [Clostridium sp.]
MMGSKVKLPVNMAGLTALFGKLAESITAGQNKIITDQDAVIVEATTKRDEAIMERDAAAVFTANLAAMTKGKVLVETPVDLSK